MSSNGRIAVFESDDRGSNPRIRTTTPVPLACLGLRRLVKPNQLGSIPRRCAEELLWRLQLCFLFPSKQKSGFDSQEVRDCPCRTAAEFAGFSNRKREFDSPQGRYSVVPKILKAQS
jgi:hypothetical protein